MSGYWLVWVDDTPVNPERPLRASEAAALFQVEAGDDENNVIEIRQCGAEELKWAAIA